MDAQTLLEMTGQENYQGVPRLTLNEVLINGDGDIEEVDGQIVHKGGYFRKRLWIDKPENGRPEETNIGKDVKIIFLKVRRKLVQRSNDGQIVRSTNEHNTADDMVDVFEGGKKVFAGSARDGREKFDGLRTVQVVYGLLVDSTKEPELVRLTIKGASLGSDSRAKELPDFYQYLSSFGKEPLCTYVTNLGVASEQGKKKYYTITFTRGDRVGEDMMEMFVLPKLTLVHEHTTKADARKDVVERPAEAEKYYPDEQISPEDIPF